MPEPLEQIQHDQQIASATAHGAFDTRKCHDASAARWAAATIPPHNNVKLWRHYTAGALARNEALARIETPRSDDLATVKRLTVTSRKVIVLFLKQFRLLFVPVLHRLRGRPAPQS